MPCMNVCAIYAEVEFGVKWMGWNDGAKGGTVNSYIWDELRLAGSKSHHHDALANVHDREMKISYTSLAASCV